MSGIEPHSPHIVVAPRGEFSKGALAHSSSRKRVFIAIAKAARLWQNVTWQASTRYEENDIRNAVGRDIEVAVIPDLAAPLRDAIPRDPKSAGRARLVFLGRISPMKNLNGALRFLRHTAETVELHVYGPIEDESYWQQCLREAENLPHHVSFLYRGVAEPEAVTRILSRADALLMPSLGENYGQVVLEALSAGCPVLLSDQTPWRDLQSKGIGWDIPLERPDEFCAAVQSIVDMDEDVHAAYRKRARQTAVKIFNDPAPIERMIKLLSASNFNS